MKKPYKRILIDRDALGIILKTVCDEIPADAQIDWLGVNYGKIVILLNSKAFDEIDPTRKDFPTHELKFIRGRIQMDPSPGLRLYRPKMRVKP